jgi:hypothetical protein
MKNTVSITLDRDSMARFARLLGNPTATGVHCGDDDGDVDGFCGTAASGAHCGDDIDE